MSTRTELIADLLMAAAHADPLQTEEPYEIVCTALKQVMGAAYLLSDMHPRLKAFDPDSFDIQSVVEALALESDVEKRQLLELIAAVHDADQIVAEEEDDFLRGVAEAMGVPFESYEDLTIEIENRVSLYEARDQLLGPPPKKPRTEPPPLPKSDD